MKSKNFGHFTNNGKAYRVTEPETPRPLLNYSWNDRFLAAINHFGSAEGAYGGRGAAYIDPAGQGRCSIIRDGARYFYIEDDATFWNPGWFPLRTPLDGYGCTHGLGHSLIEGTKNALRAALRVFVDDEHPCEIWTVNLRSDSERDKLVRFTLACDFALEGYARYSDPHGYLHAAYADGLLFAYNDAYERPHPWFNAFLASSHPVHSYDSSKKSLLGTYGSFERPASILAGGLKNSLASCEKMAGALMHEIAIPAGGSVCFHLLIGAADSMDRARSYKDTLFAPGHIEAAFAKLCAAKEAMCERISVETPDEKINILIGGWLKQQVQLCAEAGRDTGKGFRDQLQDAWAIAAFNPGLARDKIIETLRHQYSDGRCVRGWLPLDTHIYSDGPVWVALAVNGYLKETGDVGFLDERADYLDGGAATVWDHVLLSARYSSDDTGAHGLILAHDGDWNDSLNWIGIEGKGESVWTTIGMCWSLSQTAEIARHLRGDEATAREMEERRQRLTDIVNEKAWDGDWYLAAINDHNEAVGSSAETEGRIYLNSQTWAILAGVATGERREKCLAAIDKHLDSPYGPLVLSPAYRQPNPHIGRLSTFEPGIWENGTPYCHSGAFKAVADCAAGRPDRAYETLLKILPDSAENPSSHSGCEPYALTNMYLGPENKRAGETMFAWVTGTAGWIFRLVTEYMLGFSPGYNSVSFRPCLPSAWDSCRYTRLWRGALYHVNIVRGGAGDVPRVSVDGTAITGDSIPAFTSGEHMVEVVLGDYK